MEQDEDAAGPLLAIERWSWRMSALVIVLGSALLWVAALALWSLGLVALVEMAGGG